MGSNVLPFTVAEIGLVARGYIKKVNHLLCQLDECSDFLIHIPKQPVNIPQAQEDVEVVTLTNPCWSGPPHSTKLNGSLLNLKAMKLQVLFQPQHYTTLATYHNHVRTHTVYKLKKNQPVLKSLSLEMFNTWTVLISLLWPTLLWAGELDKILSSGAIQPEVLCEKSSNSSA